MELHQDIDTKIYNSYKFSQLYPEAKVHTLRINLLSPFILKVTPLLKSTSSRPAYNHLYKRREGQLLGICLESLVDDENMTSDMVLMLIM